MSSIFQPPSARRPRRVRFRPILPGATLGDRLLACLAALAAIAGTGALSALAAGAGWPLPLLVAPIGASAVLVFAVPASPLAQPWPVLGGNAISAAVGLAVAHAVREPLLAAGLGVSLAILAMSLTRSLHPPGGAAALTAVLGGPSVQAAGLLFPLVPVALNSLLLVAAGLAFHRFSGHAYPHRPALPANPHGTADPPSAFRTGFQAEDVDAALANFGESFDVERGDLERLVRAVEVEAFRRTRAPLTAADIMSRDVISVGPDADPAEARGLLLGHDIRTLPVTDAEGRLLGQVGLRELARPGGDALPVSPAVTARPETPAARLLASLTDGVNHAVVIVDAERRAVGLVSQTDLLAALASPRFARPAGTAR